MPGETLLEGGAAAGTTATAPAAGTAAAGAATSGAGAFVPADAVAFLTEHGTDPKSLEGVAEADLKTRYESAKTVADKVTAKAQAAAPKAPEKYEFKAPDGVKVDEMSAELSTIAKELKLPQEGAQKIFDVGVKLSQKFSKGLETATESMQAQWLKDSAADQEFGGEKLEENLAIARKAKDAFASEGLRKLFVDSKLGNHPEVLRLFFRLGKAMSEDKVVTGGDAGQTKPMESRLYAKSTG